MIQAILLKYWREGLALVLVAALVWVVADWRSLRGRLAGEREARKAAEAAADTANELAATWRDTAVACSTATEDLERRNAAYSRRLDELLARKPIVVTRTEHTLERVPEVVMVDTCEEAVRDGWRLVHEALTGEEAESP